MKRWTSSLNEMSTMMSISLPSKQPSKGYSHTVACIRHTLVFSRGLSTVMAEEI